jgi:hypothetical protein
MSWTGLITRLCQGSAAQQSRVQKRYLYRKEQRVDQPMIEAQVTPVGKDMIDTQQVDHEAETMQEMPPTPTDPALQIKSQLHEHRQIERDNPTTRFHRPKGLPVFFVNYLDFTLVALSSTFTRKILCGKLRACLAMCCSSPAWQEEQDRRSSLGNL